MSLKLSLATSLDSLLEQQDAVNWSEQKLEHKTPALVALYSAELAGAAAFFEKSTKERGYFSSSTAFLSGKQGTLLLFDIAVAPVLEPSNGAFRLQFLV